MKSPVNFLKAMEAIKEGETVVCLWKGTTSEYDLSDDHQLYLGEVLDGKWFILREGDE